MATPEVISLANTYIENNLSAKKTAEVLGIPVSSVMAVVEKQSAYINSVMKDIGYNNNFKLHILLDKMIDSKIEEAEESGVYTGKDLADLIKLRLQTNTPSTPNTQINVQNNVSYNDLLGRLLEDV